MHFSKIFFAILFISGLILVSCKDDDGMGMEMPKDTFDRKAMLTDWADLIIIPALDAYTERLDIMNDALNVFVETPNTSTLSNLKMRFVQAYLSWQKISMFDIGKAEALSLRNNTNIYPTDIALIISNVNAANWNLNLPSNFSAQGFPAIEYLLYGVAADEGAIVTLLQDEKYEAYLMDLVTRLNLLTKKVHEDWNSGYRESFINNDSASATASVDKLVNDFLFYYERFLRAGKIGIPAGVFSGDPIPSAIEGVYSSVYSKDLYTAAYEAVVAFFKGESYDGSIDGLSLQDYLIHIMEQNNTSDISKAILDQWTLSELQVEALDVSFQQQIIEDNMQMLETYDELQKATVLLKVDMMQALNIQIDYVDADGD